LLSCSFSRFTPQSKLPPEVNRILYVRNLPFTITAEELYAIFGKYGAIFQIRLGDKDKDTKGTAFVVYEDIYDAKTAVDHLSGFNVGGRYLIVLYYQPAKFQKRAQVEEKQKELDELRKRVQQHKTRLGK
jgi:pre-mRNA branch site protein p14